MCLVGKRTTGLGWSLPLQCRQGWVPRLAEALAECPRSRLGDHQLWVSEWVSKWVSVCVWERERERAETTKHNKKNNNFGLGGGWNMARTKSRMPYNIKLHCLTSSAYVTGWVWSPCDTIDWGSMVAQSSHWYTGHLNIKNYHLSIKNKKIKNHGHEILTNSK